MRALFVASHNKGYYAPFILEQADALRRYGGCEIDFFGVEGEGIAGYLRSLPLLRKKISEFRPDIIHAHYGLSGLLANLQRRVPVVTTYHGSDINEKSVLPFSKLSMALSRYNIFVSQRTIDIAKPQKNYALMPCGVVLNELQLTDKSVARERMGLNQEKKYVLFAGAFNNAVKNYPLAKEAMDLLPDAELIELKGYSREKVTLLMCAVDALLMTSHTEGSPQVVKEAMACGCPVVSVDVGDVSMVIDGVEGCVVCAREASELSNSLAKVFNVGRTKGREKIISLGLTNEEVAGRLLFIYNTI